MTVAACSSGGAESKGSAKTSITINFNDSTKNVGKSVAAAVPTNIVSLVLSVTPVGAGTPATILPQATLGQAELASAGATYSITNMTDNADYTFSVVAYDAGGSIIYSGSVTQTMLPAPATNPVTINCKALTVKSVANTPSQEFASGLATDGTNYLVPMGIGAAGTPPFSVQAQLMSVSTGQPVGGVITTGRTMGAIGNGMPAAAYGGGNYLMVWGDVGGGSPQIYGQLISAAGTAVGAPFAIAAAPPTRTPVVAFDGTNFLVVWESQINSIITGQFVTPSGTLSGASFAISPIGTHFSFSPVLIYVPSLNSYAVTYQSYLAASPGLYDTYLVTVSPAGALGTAVQVNQTISNGQQNPAFIAYDTTSANYMVVMNYLIGAEWKLYGRMVTSAGVPTGAEFPISTQAGSQRFGAVAFDGSKFMVAWSDERLGPTTTRIYGQQFTTAGALSGADFLILDNAIFSGMLYVGGKYVLVSDLSPTYDNLSPFLNITDVSSIFVTP